MGFVKNTKVNLRGISGFVKNAKVNLRGISGWEVAFSGRNKLIFH